MSTKESRRGFIKKTAVGAAAIATSSVAMSAGLPKSIDATNISGKGEPLPIPGTNIVNL